MTKAGGVVQTASYDFVLDPSGLLAPRGDNADSASPPVVRTGGYVGVPGDIGPDLDADQLKELNTIHVSVDQGTEVCIRVSSGSAVVRTGGYVGVPGDIGPDLDIDQLKELNTVPVSVDQGQQQYQHCSRKCGPAAAVLCGGRGGVDRAQQHGPGSTEVWVRFSGRGSPLWLPGPITWPDWKIGSLKVDHSVNHLEQCCQTCLVLTLRPFPPSPLSPFPPLSLPLPPCS